jgi:glycosyltransferase involved in cell wall biosynthesis
MFLFDAEIAGRLAGRWLGGDSLSGTARRPVFIGSERNTDYTLKLTQRIALRLTRRYCDAIIANSNAGKRFQIRRLGVDAERVFVVHNGVDTTRFAPADAEHLRAELGIDPAAPVVGMFANFKRQKNHPMFFRMARRVRQRFPSARFLCVGAPLRDGLQGSDTYHRRMHAMIESMDLSVAVNCLGTRDDVTALYNLCDVTVLTSRREGTPNVLLESMACGVPVVATDVADNASIAPNGEVGFIVSYDDDSAMADRVADLLTDEENRRRLGVQARRHVREMFSLEALARKTAEVYDTVVRRRVGGEERFKALCGAT